MNRLDVQLINLDGSDARLTRATAALQAAGIPFRRLPAFDGRGKHPEDLPLYDPAAAMRSFGRKLTGGEIGCFLSHLEAARQFLQTGADYGLVLEDDLSIATPDAGTVLTGLLDALPKVSADKVWHVANLGRAAPEVSSRLGPVEPGHLLVRAHLFPVTTTAILWSREGAASFVHDVQRIDMPVDQWLRCWASAADTGIAVNPALFGTSGAASEIDASVSRSKSVRRGPRYAIARKLWLWRNTRLARRHQAAFAKAHPQSSSRT